MATTRLLCPDKLRFQKRVAASILKCGPSKVWLDPNNRKKIAGARTRDAIRTLITENIIKFNVDPLKPKPKSTPTEIANRKVLIIRKKQHRNRMKQKAEHHRQRAKESFPMHKHPSLSHLYPEGTNFSEATKHKANRNIEIEVEDNTIQMKE